MLNVVPTKIWGAKPVDNSRLDRCPAAGITIHHTAGLNVRPLWPAPLERIRCIRLARAIQRDHIKRGWADSGHHFLVTRSGIVLEGRQGTLVAAKAGCVIQGAHAGVTQVNRTRFGIEVEGLYTTGPIPEKQFVALAELCAHLAYWGEFQSQEIDGHRDHKATECPGEFLYRMLPTLRSLVHHRKVELMHEDNP